MMLRLPALTVEEQAFFDLKKNGPSALDVLADRVRCRLAARLGVTVQDAGAWEIRTSAEGLSGAPIIEPGVEMKNTWLAARFGGAASTRFEHVTTGLTGSLDHALTCALAEAAINLGDGVAWPAAVGLALTIQDVRCEVEFIINPGHLMNWAKSEMERPG
jgi:hypothetical protein